VKVSLVFEKKKHETHCVLRLLVSRLWLFHMLNKCPPSIFAVGVGIVDPLFECGHGWVEAPCGRQEYIHLEIYKMKGMSLGSAHHRGYPASQDFQ